MVKAYEADLDRYAKDLVFEHAFYVIKTISANIKMTVKKYIKTTSTYH